MESFGLDKLYKLQCMRIAIERAIAAPSIDEKERAARWAAAWGSAAGVLTPAQYTRLGRASVFASHSKTAS